MSKLNFCGNIYLCLLLFAAPWLDLSNIENPTELHAAAMGVSTIALVLGLVMTGLAVGVFAIWRKLQVNIAHTKQYSCSVDAILFG